MVGTRKLSALAAYARRARCKLVLVGDDKQLQSIDMGGGFRALRQRLGASELIRTAASGTRWTSRPSRRSATATSSMALRSTRPATASRRPVHHRSRSGDAG